MKTVSAIGLRPLDGHEVGHRHELPQNIFDDLKARGVVKAAPKEKAAAAPAAKKNATGATKKAAAKPAK
jgi:hypothetical protein